DGGTVFLDEVSELPLTMQVKLLRAIQESEVRSVGSNRWVRINVRIVAASNRRLEDAVQDGRFRADLYFRLNVIEIRVPALRERRADIPLLLKHFLRIYKGNGHELLGVSESAMMRLMTHDWPGNVRELENCIARAVALCSGPVLRPEDLPEA